PSALTVFPYTPLFRSLAQSAGREEALRSLGDLPDPGAPVHIDSAPAKARIDPVIPSAPDRFLDESGEVQPLADIERAAIEFAIRSEEHTSELQSREKL